MTHAYPYIPSGHKLKKVKKVMSDPNQSYWLAKNGNCSVGDQCTKLMVCFYSFANSTPCWDLFYAHISIWDEQ